MKRLCLLMLLLSFTLPSYGVWGKKKSDAAPQASTILETPPLEDTAIPSTRTFEGSSNPLEHGRFLGAIRSTILSYVFRLPGETVKAYLSRREQVDSTVQERLFENKQTDEHVIYQWMEEWLGTWGIEVTGVAATFVTCRYANLYVKRQRALGKPTIFDRMWWRIKHILYGETPKEEAHQATRDDENE